MKAPTTIYTDEVRANIIRKYRVEIAKYVAIAVCFVCFCVAFCLLASFDLLNLYLACALNVVATVCFAWYGYLYFKVLFVPTRRDRAFVKCLENAVPNIVRGTFVGVEETDGRKNCLFDGSRAFRCYGGDFFEVGHEYDLSVVDGNIVSFCEVTDE